MARVNDNHFLTIEGWMRTRLGLSGNELIVFAVVYQFSQGNAGRYIGGLAFLADWCGCHIDTARRAVRNLEEQGFILPLRGEVNGVPYCNYIVNEVSLQNTRRLLQKKIFRPLCLMNLKVTRKKLSCSQLHHFPKT